MPLKLQSSAFLIIDRYYPQRIDNEGSFKGAIAAVTATATAASATATAAT